MTATPLTRQQKIFTFAGVLLGLLPAALDQTIVATAGPTIQRTLQMDAALYAWLTTAYLVTATVLIPIYGKLSDLYGRKPILLAAMAVFLAGSVICGLAPTAAVLIAGRAIQGAGSAGLFTSAFAVVADMVPPAERGKYQGIFGAVFALASVAGPLAGGVITDTLGWHWAFFINLPVGALAMAFVWLRMPRFGGRHPAEESRIDLAGALALLLAVVPLMIALSLPRGAGLTESHRSWGAWQALPLLALSAAGGVSFILIERRAPSPIMELALFRNRAFRTGVAASFITGGAFFSAIVFLPLFMTNVVGMSAAGTGLTTTPLTLSLVTGNVLSGQLATRTKRYKPILITALMLLAAGFLISGLTLDVHSTRGDVVLRLVLIGLALGPTIPLFTLAIQNAVPPDRIGVATSSAIFFRQIGATVGVALMGAIFAASLSTELGSRGAVPASSPLAAAPQEGPVASDAPPAGTAPKPNRLPGSRGQATHAQVAGAAPKPNREGPAAAASGPAGSAGAESSALDRAAQLHKEAVARATRRVLLAAALFAVSALGVTATMPELPLRTSL
jgi:EmrB/QacA subfamily drug resistance transporter